MTVLGMPGSFAQSRDGAPLPVPGRSLVASVDGIVAASQPLAARAGVQILERGGNAMDAAIAANATMGLMEPTGNGVGGDLFALVFEAKTGRLYGLNASGWAPTGFTVDALAAKGITKMPERGVYTVSVPGVVAGWSALSERFGRFKLATLLAPAIHHAERGFPVAELTARGWKAQEDLLNATPASRATFTLNGHAPTAGQLFRNPDLARTLRRIAERGRDGFYKGETAEAIVSALGALGGTMTAADLAEFQAEWVDPISTTYRGWKVSEIPPQGQGIAALDDAEPDGAVSARGVRLPQPAVAARDDRSEEAGLCGHAPLRRRSAVHEGAGRVNARQGAGYGTGAADRCQQGRVSGDAPTAHLDHRSARQ